MQSLCTIVVIQLHSKECYLVHKCRGEKRGQNLRVCNSPLTIQGVFPV